MRSQDLSKYETLQSRTNVFPLPSFSGPSEHGTHTLPQSATSSSQSIISSKCIGVVVPYYTIVSAQTSHQECIRKSVQHT